jgi:uncharacterized protein (DUF1800 family)
VVHLHRRAGFAATWDEIERDLADGPKASIDRLLAGKSRLRGIPDGFEDTAAALAKAAVEENSLLRLKAWWIYRMLFGPDPLRERLTLLWHNHFATSNLKVKDLAGMRRQNDLFRAHARAPFGELLNAAVHDPALLIWLDATTSRKEQPNENLGRELMELFTLGVGHYTETDVKEAARALTGWTVAAGKFREDLALHDRGEKTVLGHTGRWTGADLVSLLLEQPATAERLAARVCDLLLGEGVGDASRLAALAAGLRERNLDIGWAVRTVLRSDVFFAEQNLGNRVLGPVEYIVGAVRALELFDPAPSTLLLAEWAARLGQDLFYPPNVFGWPGGRDWLTTRSLIARSRFAVELVEGKLTVPPQLFSAYGLAERHQRRGDYGNTIAFMTELVLGLDPGAAWRDRLAAGLPPGTAPGSTAARRTVALLLASPEAQLG